MAQISKLTVTLPAGHSEDDRDRLSALLARHLAHGWEEDAPPSGDFRCIIHVTHERLRDELTRVLSPAMPELRFAEESVEDRNWAEAWKEFFMPVVCGSHFLVLAPWMTAERAASARLSVIIEPKTAFGTGHHASTALCLEAVSRLADAGRLQSGMRFLDVGTGSGILAIACARLGMSGDAVDTDPAAVLNAEENRELNGLPADRIRIVPGSVEQAHGSYHLIMANILAAPLMDMAPAIALLPRVSADVAPLLILSGILDTQADAVENAYRDRGFACAQRVIRGEWAALIFG